MKAAAVGAAAISGCDCRLSSELPELDRRTQCGKRPSKWSGSGKENGSFSAAVPVSFAGTYSVDMGCKMAKRVSSGSRQESERDEAVPLHFGGKGWHRFDGLPERGVRALARKPVEGRLSETMSAQETMRCECCKWSGKGGGCWRSRVLGEVVRDARTCEGANKGRRSSGRSTARAEPFAEELFELLAAEDVKRVSAAASGVIQLTLRTREPLARRS